MENKDKKDANMFDAIAAVLFLGLVVYGLVLWLTH